MCVFSRFINNSNGIVFDNLMNNYGLNDVDFGNLLSTDGEINSCIRNKLLSSVFEKHRNELPNGSTSISLRQLQIIMLNAITNTYHSPYTDNLIPYFYDDASIVLFYNTNYANLGLFFCEKHESTYDGRIIISKLVFVTIRSIAVYFQGQFVKIPHIEYERLYLDFNFENGTLNFNKVRRNPNYIQITSEHLETIELSNTSSMFKYSIKGYLNGFKEINDNLQNDLLIAYMPFILEFWKTYAHN